MIDPIIALSLTVIGVIVLFYLLFCMKRKGFKGFYNAFGMGYVSTKEIVLTTPNCESPVPGLYCPRCGRQGTTIREKEKGGKMLGIVYWLCLSCRTKWYDAEDVLAIAFTLSQQRGEKPDQV